MVDCWSELKWSQMEEQEFKWKYYVKKKIHTFTQFWNGWSLSSIAIFLCSRISSIPRRSLVGILDLNTKVRHSASIKKNEQRFET